MKLEITELWAGYRGLHAVRGLTMHVADGEFVALIGSNGAGKSTTLNTVAGLMRPTSGRIRLDGKDITGWPAHRVVREGLTLVPEGRMVVAPLTVEENLLLSTFSSRCDPETTSEVYELFPRLAERRKQVAGSLSGGEQQMLAIARAMLTRPKVLLLDEPSMGLAPAIIDVVFDAIDSIHRAGQAILLVEQNGELALDVCDKAYVLQRGELALSGSSEELRGSESVITAYLG